jgi:hypothetical protein
VRSVGWDCEDGAVGGGPVLSAHANSAVAVTERADREAIVRMTRERVIVVIESKQVERPDRKLDSRYMNAALTLH